MVRAFRVFSALTIYLNNWKIEILKRTNEADNHRMSQSVDSLLNVETVKYYGAEKYEVETYQKALLMVQNAEFLSFKTSCILETFQNIIICGSLLACSLLCAYLVVEKGSLTQGQYVLFASYVQQLYSRLNGFGSFYG